MKCSFVHQTYLAAERSERGQTRKRSGESDLCGLEDICEVTKTPRESGKLPKKHFLGKSLEAHKFQKRKF